MAKTPKCKNCLKDGHYKTWCPTLPKKPIKKPIKRSVTASKAKKAKTPTKKKPIAKKRSWYVKELDRVFSIYIRQTKPAECVTCGKKDDWKNLQNGHYYSRSKLPTRWDEDNCNPQCVGCNVFKSGNYTEYALFMLKTLGEDKLRELHELANSGEKISTADIKELIEFYKKKIT